MMIIKNIWGYEGNYTISFSGIVKDKKGNAVKPFIGKTGYNLVLLKKGDKELQKRVDKLVAYHFVHNPKPKKLTEVIPKDNKISNLTYTNLKWVTEKEFKKWKKELTLKLSQPSKRPSKGLIAKDTYTKKDIPFASPKEASLKLGIPAPKIRKALRSKTKIGIYEFRYS